MPPIFNVKMLIGVKFFKLAGFLRYLLHGVALSTWYNHRWRHCNVFKMATNDVQLKQYHIIE
jgi:hypothetical protein